MCAHVLVAEDDPKQAELVRLYLEREHHEVTVVGDGRSAIEEVRGRRPALLILDVMLPLVDGLDVARILRAETTIPILMLTARSTEDDLLLGLDLGADDYVTKPFSPRELMARVRTLLRRTHSTPPPSERPVAAGPLSIDRVRHVVTLGDMVLDLTPTEFSLLETFATEPERVFSRTQLLERLHGFDRFITARSIDMHVKNLRKKIEPRPESPRFLVTVFGVGYKLTLNEPNAS